MLFKGIQFQHKIKMMIKIASLLFLMMYAMTVSGCVTFSVSAGTGCAWMCNYCAQQLSTNNYYFTDGVCTYQSGVGCVGNPIAGKMYTCCATSEESDEAIDEAIDEASGEEDVQVKEEL
jgi:hypothetical protein